MSDDGAVRDSKRTTPHSVRTTEALWASGVSAARSDGVPLAQTMSDLIEGFTLNQVDLLHPVDRHDGPRQPSHSIRLRDDVWRRLQARAGQVGLTANEIIERILSDYSSGRLVRPRVFKDWGRGPIEIE